MKKLKSFYKNNRVFVILMSIAIFCIAVIGVWFVYIILSQNSGDLYGDRLNGIESVQISATKLAEIEEKILKNDTIEKATVRTQGKIVYFSLYVKNIKLDDAKAIAVSTIEEFTEDEKAFYDISYALINEEKDSSYTVMGYKKNDKTIITWTNHSE